MLAISWYDNNYQPNDIELEDNNNLILENDNNEDNDINEVYNPWKNTFRECWVDEHDMSTSSPLYPLILPTTGDINPSDYFINDIYTELSKITLEKFLESKELCDIRLCDEGNNSVLAHKHVLSAHSHYFKTLCNDIWKCSPSNSEVHLDYPLHILQLVIQYCYTGSVAGMLSDDFLIPCLHLAHHLLIPALVELLSEEVIHCIDGDNVSLLLSLADSLDLKLLKERCLSFAVSHVADIESLEHFNDLPPRIQQAIRVLQRSYSQSRSTYGDIFHSASELLAMMGEAQDEAEEVYEKAKLRNDAELALCRSELEASSSEHLHLRLQRLTQVDINLQHQKEKLRRRREFYIQQKSALDAALRFIA